MTKLNKNFESNKEHLLIPKEGPDPLKGSRNPIYAHSAEEAELLRASLPGVPVKIKPERIPSRNSGLLDMILKDAGDGKVSIRFGIPERVPATTEFIDVETKDGVVHVPVLPAGIEGPHDQNILSQPMLNPELGELEERARRMQGDGPNPDLPI